ncbi:MAG: leucyl/phenylalanyl-tRNA--protein transferase [Pseudomonadota bacterium]
MPRDAPEITSELLLMAYASGVFPMAESRDDPDIFWVDPDRRGVLPLDGFRLSRSLAKTIRKGRFRITLNADFNGVLEGCANREETWINPAIAALYQALHQTKHAHSLEVWDSDDLAGGIYGVTLGAAFFGESMFSNQRDASKVALAHLVALLRARGFLLFDTQFLTDHLASLGAVEIPRLHYHAQLRHALAQPAQLAGPVPNHSEVMHLRSQTS